MTQTPFAASKLDGAKSFLQAALADGPRPAAVVEAEGIAKGITHTTLQAARQRLHVKSKRQGNQWVWIPPAAWPVPQPVAE